MKNQGFIDIHSHVLPFVDDGSKSMEESLLMVKTAYDEGITDIFFTPHYRLDMFLTPWQKEKEVFDDFTAKITGLGIPINCYLGQELHNAPEMLGQLKDGKAITLNGSKYVLIELSWHCSSDYVLVIKEYIDAGYQPIVVHYERYPYSTVDGYKQLKKAGALFQINAYSLFGWENEKNKEFALKMLEDGCVDFVASDMHGGSKFKDRNFYIKDAYELVKERFGKEVADNIFINNALKILGK